VVRSPHPHRLLNADRPPVGLVIIVVEVVLSALPAIGDRSPSVSTCIIDASSALVGGTAAAWLGLNKNRPKRRQGRSCNGASVGRQLNRRMAGVVPRTSLAAAARPHIEMGSRVASPGSQPRKAVPLPTYCCAQDHTPWPRYLATTYQMKRAVNNINAIDHPMM
jgi:hypothetical protein